MTISHNLDLPRAIDPRNIKHTFAAKNIISKDFQIFLQDLAIICLKNTGDRIINNRDYNPELFIPASTDVFLSSNMVVNSIKEWKINHNL